MTDLALLQRLNDRRWLAAKITRNFSKPADIAFANKDRYIKIVRMLRDLGSNMPDEAWCFIAAIHYRESNFNFNTHLGQGDPLTINGRAVKTTHVPAGRGPFTGPDAFEKAAVDALWYCAPYAAKSNKDWSISGMLTYLERYNGLAYANASRPSPYVWSGTNIYDPPTGPGGKVLVDHGPIVNVTDKQLGVAGLLLAIDAEDDTINFGSLPEVTLQPALPEPDKVPVDGVFDTVWLQWALNQLGATPQLRVDGINGGGTKAAVRAYQKSHKLKVDGIAGTLETIPSIKAELKKANKIAEKVNA